MAHLRKIAVRDCYSPGCQSKATVTLYTNRNAQLGDYCRKHGEQAEKRLQRDEEAELGSRS